MILVTGGTGYTGGYLLRRLRAQGAAVRCLVRLGRPASELDELGVEVRVGDLAQPATLAGCMDGVDLVLHLAHIRLAPALLAAAGTGVGRLVLLSSRRRFSQVPSASVAEVVDGEDAVLRSSLPWVLLRPTMIYGPGDDRNVSRIAGHLRRSRWIPVPGCGQCLLQPVYVEDMVDGILAAGQQPQAVGRAYDLAGPRALTYDQLVDQVGAAVGVAPRKVHVPVPVVLGALRVARWLGLRPGLDREQVLRMQEDKACSISAARQELGFDPLEFAAGLARAYRGGRPA